MGKHVDEVREAMEKFQNGEEFVWTRKNEKGEDEEVRVEATYDKQINDAKKEIEESEIMLERLDADEDKSDNYEKMHEKLTTLQSELNNIKDDDEKARKQEEIEVVQNLFNQLKDYKIDMFKAKEFYVQKIEKAKATIAEYEQKKSSVYMLDEKNRLSKRMYYEGTKVKFENELAKVRYYITRYEMDIIIAKGKIASAEDEQSKNKWEKELARMEEKYAKLLEDLPDIEEAIKLCDEQKEAIYENALKEKTEVKIEEKNPEEEKGEGKNLDDEESENKVVEKEETKQFLEEIDSRIDEEFEKLNNAKSLDEIKQIRVNLGRYMNLMEKATAKVYPEEDQEKLEKSNSILEKSIAELQKKIMKIQKEKPGKDRELNLAKLELEMFVNRNEQAFIKRELDNRDLDNSDLSTENLSEIVAGSFAAPVVVKNGFFRRAWEAIKGFGRKVLGLSGKFKDIAVRDTFANDKMTSALNDSLKAESIEEKDSSIGKKEPGNIEERLEANAKAAREKRAQEEQFKVEGVEGKFDPTQNTEPRSQEDDGKGAK